MSASHVLLLSVLLAGCGSTEPDPEPARAPTPGELLITQLYTTGASSDGINDHYYSDQFIELSNASTSPLDLSGVRVADVFGTAGAIIDGFEPDSFRDARPDEVVMSTVWRIPDDTRLEPGATLLIAQDGTNHRPFSTVDLSAATFEAYAADSVNDQDHPTAPNLESIVYNGGFDWLMTVFGPSVVVFDADTPLTEVRGRGGPWPTVAVSAILDGVDTVMDADSADFKRLPDAVDAGFAYTDGTYTGTALHRVRTADGWQDTNDSSADFTLGEPEVTQSVSTGEVTGTPTIALGTGTSAYEPLDDGDTVEIVAGIQGGWHVDVSVWCTGFEPGGATVVYDAVTLDADSVSYLTEAVLFDSNVLPAEDGWYRVGDRVVFDVDDPNELVGTEVVLRATAALGGASWSAERVVTVVDDVP